MNKIERAIYDTKLHIEKLEQDRMVLVAKIDAYKKQLETLEAIDGDKTIPHQENAPAFTIPILTDEPDEVPLKKNMKTKMTANDFLSEIRQYLDAKYGENYTFSPTMIDPITLGVQMAIMEKTNHGVERKFDLVIKDRGEQIKNS